MEYLGQSLAGRRRGGILRVTIPGARKRSRGGERLMTTITQEHAEDRQRANVRGGMEHAWG